MLGPIFLIALFLLRASMKQSQREKEGETTYGSLPSRSLYVGFLGKVVGQVSFFMILLAIMPALNGGVFEFADSIRVQYGADPTTSERMLYFIWCFTLIITPAAIGFEALMFVHATLKDTVFGIDSICGRPLRTRCSPNLAPCPLCSSAKPWKTSSVMECLAVWPWVRPSLLGDVQSSG